MFIGFGDAAIRMTVDELLKMRWEAPDTCLIDTENKIGTASKSELERENPS